MTWPDAFYVDYDYDVSGAVTKIRENGATSGTGVLASFAYDDQGRRTSITRGNGVTTSYGFDALSRLASLTQNLSGTADDQTYGFSYTPASQIASQSETNDTWGWLPQYNAADTYTINGINEFLTINSVIPTYDTNGNLTGIGSDVYTYDSANRLKTAKSGSGATVNFAYDPADRLFETAGSATTRFQYDGTDMIAEYNTSGTVLRRYVHGPALDEPLVWYEGSTTATRKWLVTDTRGSIAAVTDASGAAEEINTYTPYGVPGDTNLGRFQYTSQTYISDDGINLYYYKARFYSADIGRFLQTDPIGYGDGMNMYAYAGGDPINASDPSGLDRIIVTGTRIDTGITGPSLADFLSQFFNQNAASISSTHDASGSIASGAKKATDKALCGDGGTSASNADAVARDIYPGGSDAELSSLANAITSGLNRSVTRSESKWYGGEDIGAWITGGKRYGFWGEQRYKVPRMQGNNPSHESAKGLNPGGFSLSTDQRGVANRIPSNRVAIVIAPYININNSQRYNETGANIESDKLRANSAGYNETAQRIDTPQVF